MEINTLHHLVKSIRDYTSKIDIIDFKLDQITSLLERYCGEDWYNYIYHNNPNYTKVKIPLTNANDIFEIYLICWNKGAISPIHDHSENGCIVKILKGKLNEFRYNRYEENNTNTNLFSFFKKKKKNIKNDKKNCICYKLECNTVSYIHNDIAIHQIANSIDDTAYSLHIYSPCNYDANIY